MICCTFFEIAGEP
jgi:hypothetical protein